jgi:amino acid transporter
LAVLSSDAISSVAYGPEAALLVLSAAGAGALALNLPISAAIVVLLVIVTFSYRQTIFAYPSGGGSYIVASENLGRIPGLIAASALLIDYVLTVAVSVASGVAALVSALPALSDDVVPIGLAFIGMLAIGNLRGVRESGALFAAPTYLFIVSLLALVAIGVVRVLILHDSAATGVPRSPVPGGEAVGVLLILKAFSSGCTAMTGIEAVSNGVPCVQIAGVAQSGDHDAVDERHSGDALRWHCRPVLCLWPGAGSER